MKRIRYPYALLIAIVFVAGTFTGCAKKTGMDQQAKTSSTMQKVEQNIQQAAAQIDATNSSLDNLVSGQPADLEKAFSEYSENVSKMEDVGNQLLSQMNDMTAQGNEYFEEWRKEGETYVNPDIRRLSEERRVQLRRSFTNVADASIGVRGGLNQYLSEIKEINTYLSNNLADASIQAIAPVAQRTIADGRNLKDQLRPVQTAIDRTRAQMTPGGAAGGGASVPDQSGAESGSLGTGGTGTE